MTHPPNHPLKTCKPAHGNFALVHLWCELRVLLGELKVQGPSRTCNESKEQGKEEEIV